MDGIIPWEKVLNFPRRDPKKNGKPHHLPDGPKKTHRSLMSFWGTILLHTFEQNIEALKMIYFLCPQYVRTQHFGAMGHQLAYDLWRIQTLSEKTLLHLHKTFSPRMC